MFATTGVLSASASAFWAVVALHVAAAGLLWWRGGLAPAGRDRLSRSMATTPQLRPAERLVFFTDAVVAIAMTLLILPLLESVGDAAREGLDTISYLVENQGRLVAFALSFVIISVFWRSHDRLFELVERQDNVLLRLNVAWMFTIVWLPVATALVGSMPTDPLQLALYIGTMLATSLLTLAMRWWLGHRDLGWSRRATASTPPGSPRWSWSLRCSRWRSCWRSWFRGWTTGRCWSCC